MVQHVNRARAKGSDAQGFTLVEVAIVCAILGVLALLAFPSMRLLGQQHGAKSSAATMAGLLEEARSRAISEATPHLVYVNAPSVDENGECEPAAELVRDTDRSYSITAGDDVREVRLPDGACEKVRAYGESGGTPFADLPLPTSDYAVRAVETAAEDDDEEGAAAAAAAAAKAAAAGEAASGSGRTTTDGRVTDAVVNGSTFPLDEDSGRPVVAFSERGIPVDPSSPTRWGSGAGAIYLTDGETLVYAAIVQPMGGVQLRAFDPSTGEWR